MGHRRGEEGVPACGRSCRRRPVSYDAPGSPGNHQRRQRVRRIHPRAGGEGRACRRIRGEAPLGRFEAGRDAAEVPRRHGDDRAGVSAQDRPGRGDCDDHRRIPGSEEGVPQAMIPLMKNAFYKEYETRKALSEFILQAGKLSMGERCVEFEKAFAKRQGRAQAILFNSGGSANLALIQGLRNMETLGPGERVGFSALTWSTNVMPILQMGLVPVPIDCEPATLNVTSRTLAERIGDSKLKALFITNALGFAGDLDAIRKMCGESGILLLEDNCEALGTELPAGRTGNFGLASTFSFFVAHHMSTIEGGMVATDDDDLADMLRVVRANGWDRNLSAVKQLKWRKRFNVPNELQAKYTFYDLGFNFRPTEIT